MFKGKFEDYSSPLAGLPARLFTGYLFLTYGLEKATGDFGGEKLRGILSEWAGGSAYAFYVPFLTRVAIPYAEVFALLVILGEIVVGAALVAGFATRAAAIVGIFMCLNFALAEGSPLISAESQILFGMMFLTVYLTAAGRALGLDALFKRVLPRWAA